MFEENGLSMHIILHIIVHYLLHIRTVLASVLTLCALNRLNLREPCFRLYSLRVSMGTSKLKVNVVLTVKDVFTVQLALLVHTARFYSLSTSSHSSSWSVSFDLFAIALSALTFDSFVVKNVFKDTSVLAVHNGWQCFHFYGFTTTTVRLEVRVTARIHRKRSTSARTIFYCDIYERWTMVIGQ